jgi:multiple sugar transport system substrate-binding protein
MFKVLPAYARFAALIIVAIHCIGCSSERDSPGALASSLELMYWPAPNQQEVQLADSLVRKWNRLHPGIQVRMQPIPVSQSTEEVLLAAIAGKTTPDVCSNIWPGALHEYTRAGGLIPFDQFSDFDSIASSRTPRELLKTFQSPNGHFYQIPWKTNPLMMFYNERLLREAGVTVVPRTYSEYLAAGKKVSRDINGDGQIDVWMGERDIRPIWWQRLMDFYPFYIAASNGKTLFENGNVAFGNRSSEAVLQFFQDCYSRRLFPRTFFQGGDPFFLEQKATHFGGPWQVAAIHKFAPQIRYGVASIPVPDDHTGPVFTAGDFKNISVFGNTKHPREAWEFVKFLVAAEHDLLLLEICDQIPVRGDLLTNPLFADYFKRNPVMVSFAEQAVYTRGMDAAPDLKEIFDGISQEYEMCAVYGKKTPAQAVQDAVRRTQVIVEWNR